MENTNNFYDWYLLFDFIPVNNHVVEREYVVDALSFTRINWMLDQLVNFLSQYNLQYIIL